MVFRHNPQCCSQPSVLWQPFLNNITIRFCGHVFCSFKVWPIPRFYQHLEELYLTQRKVFKKSWKVHQPLTDYAAKVYACMKTTLQSSGETFTSSGATGSACFQVGTGLDPAVAWYPLCCQRCLHVLFGFYSEAKVYLLTHTEECPWLGRPGSSCFCLIQFWRFQPSKYLRSFFVLFLCLFCFVIYVDVLHSFDWAFFLPLPQLPYCYSDLYCIYLFCLSGCSVFAYEHPASKAVDENGTWSQLESSKTHQGLRPSKTPVMIQMAETGWLWDFWDVDHCWSRRSKEV